MLSQHPNIFFENRKSSWFGSVQTVINAFPGLVAYTNLKLCTARVSLIIPPGDPAHTPFHKQSMTISKVYSFFPLIIVQWHALPPDIPAKLTLDGGGVLHGAHSSNKVCNAVFIAYELFITSALLSFLLFL